MKASQVPRQTLSQGVGAGGSVFKGKVIGKVLDKALDILENFDSFSLVSDAKGV